MKKISWLAVVLAILTAACGHKQQDQASAESGRAPVGDQGGAAAQPAGAPVYPRAQLVALPGTTNTAPATPAIPATPAMAAASETSPTPNEPVNAAPGVPTETPGATSEDSAASPAALPAGLPAPPPGDTATDTNAPTTAVALTNDVPPAPVEIKTDDIQVVVLQTTFGRMVLQLDDFAAPKTCANFRTLVSSGFYNGTIFHRVIPHFVIQGGDPNSKTDNRATYGQGDPGYTLPPEIKLSHDRGAVAMARLPDPVNPGRNSNGSQFYICVEACPSLDDQYTVFAHVIQGMDVAERIANVPRDKRDDPLVRIAMDARLEPKDQAMQDVPAVAR